jgi:N-acetylglucosaminyldiphosphoundecaprenol N-acetyl-beta-D-mannosaminyltransferase
MADRHDVLTLAVEPIPADAAAQKVTAWAADARGRVVCAANVHMVMEAWDDPGFADAVRGADLVVCDGRPLVWACRLDGVAGARQARGLDVLFEVCAAAEREGLGVGLYGGRPEVTAAAARRLRDGYPDLRLDYAWSPPFRPLDTAEDEEVVAAIAAASVQILFVGLGCPRQEQWMVAHRDRLPCVMLGVGAAFDFVGGGVSVAPRWLQVAGLEWAYRLWQEPRRLWRRYARHNLRFVVLVASRRLSPLWRRP